MRYSVQYQNTSDDWVIFDKVECYMMPGRFRSEEQALLAALNMTEQGRKRGNGLTYTIA
jgi:hypothetical protein